ncbi:MAG: ATP-grasp domain-containing protein [Solirubrobacteraceae bacterium]
MRAPSGIDTSVPVVVLNLFDHGSLGIARSLGRWGVAVHGVHDRRTSASRSRYLRSFHRFDGAFTDPRLIAFLEQLSGRLGGRPVLIPTSDAACLAVEDHAAELAEWFRFPPQPAGLARALSSKSGMHELCAAHGVPTPATIFPRARSEVESYAVRGAFPVMLKAIDGYVQEQRDKKRMVVARSADQLLSAYDELEHPARPNLMIQEYVPGDAASVWIVNGYFGPDAQSTVSFTGKMLHQCPPATGSTSLGVCQANAEVEALTLRFMRDLGYRGILDCDFRFDSRDGRYKLLDVNPRVGASFRLFVGPDGSDVVKALYLNLTGQPVAPATLDEGRKWVVESNDLVSFALARSDGRPRAAEWLRSFRGVQEAAWWALDDPVPAAAVSAELLRRAGKHRRWRRGSALRR